MNNKRVTYGNEINYILEILNKSHYPLIKTFYSGNDAIDDYLKNEALFDKEATTYIFLNKGNDDVICLFSINCSGVTCLCKSEAGDEYIDVTPAIEIQFFAMNEKYQGMPYSRSVNEGSLSRHILFQCIDYITDSVCSLCAASVLILYSVPDTKAVKLYQRAGFIKFKDYMVEKTHPFLGGCIPMFMNLIE